MSESRLFRPTTRASIQRTRNTPAVCVAALALSAGASAQAEFFRVTANVPAPTHLASFGNDTAVSSDFLAVGAPGELVLPPFHDGIGAVFVYRLDAVLDYVAFDLLAATGVGFGPAPLDAFGTSLAFEGHTLAVGAPGFFYTQDVCGPRTGAVIVFEQDPVTLQFPKDPITQDFTTAVLVGPSTGVDGEQFGYKVVLDGNRLFVGAPAAEHGSGGNPGAVYVFERSGAAWTEVQKIFATAPQDGARFGQSLDVQGSELVIGSPFEDIASGQFEFSDVGAAYRFEHVPGVGWVQRNRIVAGSHTGGAQFGNAIAIGGDTVVVGAPGEQGGQLSFTGNVHAFDRVDQGTPSVSDDTWTLSQSLAPASTADRHRFGEDVDVEGDLLVVGAPWNHREDNPRGLVFVYDRPDTTWLLRTTIAPRDPLGCCGDTYPGPVGDQFGYSVLISQATNEADHGLFVGAPRAYTGESNSCRVSVAGSDPRCPQLPGCSPNCPPVSIVQSCPATTSCATSCLEWPSDEFSTLPGAAYRYRLTLQSSARTVDLSDGGTQRLFIDVGPVFAGRPYLMLGSFTGVVPGSPLGPVLVPLNTDSYSAFVVSQPNSYPFTDFFGTLDANGKAVAEFTADPGSSPDYAGTYYHAAAIFDGPSLQTVVLATNAVELVLLP